MSSYLTWTEARDLALAGTPVRRDAWVSADPPSWLERRPGLWVLTNLSHAVTRVVDAAWFDKDDFYAEDWTTDPPGTERDVCLIDSPRRIFIPPGISLTGELDSSTLTLHADIGASSPAGVFIISFFLEDGTALGTLEAATPGRYSLTTAFDPEAYAEAARIRAWIDVRASLPLPAWTGHAEWETIFPPGSPDYIAVAISPLFYNTGNTPANSWFIAGGRDCGVFPGDRWIYSHAASPVGADDDFSINGILQFPNGYADTLNGGATTFLQFLPAGRHLVLNVWNSGGSCYAVGELRLYNRPI